MTCSVSRGCVRAGGAWIQIEGEVNARLVTFQFRGESDSAVTLERVWPDDFDVVSEGGTQMSSIVLANIEGFRPFCALEVWVGGERVPEGPHYHLKNMFAYTETDFEARYFRLKNRVKDAETLAFSMRQILEFYQGREDHKCVAAVIYGYKALDTLRVDCMNDAKDKLYRQYKLASQLPLTDNPRTDGDHLRISLAMVLWHLELCLGRRKECFEILDDVLEFCEKLSNPMPGSAYNLCRMALFRAYTHFRSGEIEDCIRVNEINFNFYVRSYGRAEMHAVRFTEMIDAHHAVALSLQMREKLLSSKRNIDSDTVFSSVNRVTSDQGMEKIRTQYKAVLRTCDKLKRTLTLVAAQ
ncbi:hypothetical protein [Mycoplana rhizolycopersici]|uniref:Uncharacterized protein n=1 Tax=Mycoplana rhizolycopersici TaxID=2746702 RepID=A0ABX2QD21_9HYPH|nr:hypothetical protein [Rhizobium rhizolycopersici]NVP54859.1 hypothetical protein [Rhizobium rhizolycopersici]